jgi:hypothetical protein
MPKYDIGDILEVKPIDRTDRSWHFLITRVSEYHYYFFYLDNGDSDWSSIDGVDNSERISFYA